MDPGLIVFSIEAREIQQDSPRAVAERVREHVAALDALLQLRDALDEHASRGVVDGVERSDGQARFPDRVRRKIFDAFIIGPKLAGVSTRSLRLLRQPSQLARRPALLLSMALAAMGLQIDLRALRRRGGG